MATPPAGSLPAPAGSATAQYQFSRRRLTITDQIIAAAAALLLISLWLPWFGSGGFAVGALNAHEYMGFVLITSLILIIYLAARAGWDRLPFRLPVAHAPLLLVLGVIQLIIVVIGFLSTPRYLSHQFGAWLGLVAAVASSLPILVPAIQSAQRR
jgi:hypothetical protein